MSKAAGVAVVTVVGAGTAAGVYAAVPDVTVLGLWVVATGSVWWAVTRPVASTANHSPPPPEPPSENENTQVREIVQDKDNPARHKVVWHTEGTAK